MARQAGTKNRNYPPVGLADALQVSRAIADRASGMPTSRLTLSELLDRKPASSAFGELVQSSRAYGLTSGGYNADEFALEELGVEANSADEVTQQAALRKAVLNVEPFKIFLQAHAGKKLPAATPFKEYLTKNAGVPSERAEECMEQLLADTRFVGFIRSLKGSDYIDLTGASTATEEVPEEETEGPEPTEDEASLEAPEEKPSEPPPASPPAAPKKVFIAHGKNRTPLDQLKKALDPLKVQYAVAVDEPHKGRPISEKVAQLMREECSSAIFIFTADERFLRETKDGETEEVWRPSENVVYELGAASVLYGRRIVIFKEKGVTFPSDYSDLGYIEFEKDQLVAEIGSLYQELVALDILEVRAKG